MKTVADKICDMCDGPTVPKWDDAGDIGYLVWERLIKPRHFDVTPQRGED